MNFDQNVTRIPFGNEREMWVGDEVALYRMEDGLFGRAGEVAEHLIVSTVNARDDEPAESVVVVADEDGEPVGPYPVLTVAATTDHADLLGSIGFTDVTSA